jgi:signal transduction histidine kinase
VDVNSAWVRVFGRMRTEVIGSNEDALGLWKEQRVRQHALGLLARDGELTRFGAWMSAGMGRTDMLCEVSGRAITLGTQSLTIMAYEDVTDAHEYEEKILSLNSGLEQRVDERTRELSDTLQRLTTTQADLIRSEKLSALGSLVAGIAHELNTPIGNSLTVASTLQDQVRALDSHMKAGLRRSDLDGFLTQGREGVDILMRSLEHAAELVASFKQVAVDQTSVKRRNFDLRETVQELLHTLGPSLRKTPYTVQVAIPPGIRLDSYPGPLCQVITNLVNNAVVHAFDGRSEGTIEIQAKVQAQLKGGEHVVIHVQDNGRGIAPAHLAKVFDPFFTTRLGLGGSGLGLNIVYNLVHKTLGGTIAVDSMLGYGACFTLTLAMVAPELKDTE